MRKIILSLLPLLPMQGFSVEYVVCYEEAAVQKEIKRITENGGIVDEIKPFIVNDHLKDSQDNDGGLDDLKKTIINLNLTAYRIKYRTEEEIKNE